MTTATIRLRDLLMAIILAFGTGLACGGQSGAGNLTSNAAALSSSGPFSGQRAVGQSTVEPAVNDADGSQLFLLTPNHAPFPSNASQRAVAPMYIPMYPSTSVVNPATLNCQPHNCDHLNVLPFPVPGYVNGGSACTQFGFPSGACSLVLGHDHLVGIRPTGDFNIAWHVVLVVFTPQGIAAGADNSRVLTLAGVHALVANGGAFIADTPDTFNCSSVSEVVYLSGTPLSF
jgi:hypothetical protein